MNPSPQLPQLLLQPTAPNVGQYLTPSQISGICRQNGCDIQPQNVERFLQRNHFDNKRVMQGNDLSTAYHVELKPIAQTTTNNNQVIVHLPEDKRTDFLLKFLAAALAVSVLVNFLQAILN